MALLAPPRPCNTCPYRKDTPRGIWEAHEYAKLAEYDAHPGPVAVFHCHQQNTTGVDTVCRGWLAVHRDSLAVRFAVMRGVINVRDAEADVDVPLYASGAAAMRAGLAAVKRPGKAARKAVAKLAARMEGRVWRR